MNRPSRPDLKRLCFYVINIRVFRQFCWRKDLSLAKKKKIEQPKPRVTKHQLSRWERQKKRQRIILIVGVSIIVAALLIIGVGWFLSQFQPMHQTVIRVNDTEFDMEYYVEMLKIYSWNQSESYIQYISDEVVKNIERNELVRQEALKLGVNISEDEVTEELKNYDLPENEVRRDIVRAQLIIRRLLDEYFDPQVPVTAEQVHIMAILLESEQQATEVRAKLEKGESFTELAGEFSLDYLSKTSQGDFDWHPKVIFNELLPEMVVEHAFSAKTGTLSQLYDETVDKAVGYWLVKVVAMNEDTGEAHVQALLLGSEAEAKDIVARVKGGEDFDALVQESGGESEITPPGVMSPVVDEFIFDPDLEIGILSQPIRDDNIVTEGGYWLVKVEGKEENRPIGDEDRDLLKGEAIDDWIDSLWDNPENEVDSYLTDEKKLWAIEQVMRGL